MSGSKPVAQLKNNLGFMYSPFFSILIMVKWHGYIRKENRP